MALLATSHLIVTAVIFLAMALLAIRGLAWNQVKGFLALGWLISQGTVKFGSVQEYTVRGFTFHNARIEYSYAVNGEYYSGYRDRMFLLSSSADRFVDGMKAQVVFVRYKPGKPEQSALLERDQPAGWPT